MNSKPLKILYTNYKGETSIRNIIPQEIYFGSNEWHKEEQWLMEALDVDKNAVRTFAVEDINFIYSNDDAKRIDIINNNLL